MYTKPCHMIDKLTNIGVEYLPAMCEREFDSGGGRSKPTNEFVSHRGGHIIDV